MNQKTIKLDRFVPRSYQEKLVTAFEQGKIKRFVAIWPRRCLSGDSHIVMADGSWKYLKDIQEGDEILSWNGSKFVPDKVKYHWKTELKSTKMVQSYSCLPLISSQDHVFATNKHSSKVINWKKLSEVTKNDPLMQYAGTFSAGVNDNYMPEFLGYMLSDGYCSDYNQPKFTNSNKIIIDRVRYLVKQLFNVRVINDIQDNCTVLRFPEGNDNDLPSVKQQFVRFGINCPKKERRLPKVVWSWNEQEILSFFSGLISGDGNIYTHSKERQSRRIGQVIPVAVEVTLNFGESDLYAWDCYWLLRKIGIVPQVPYKERGSNWKIKIAKCLDIKKILENRIYGKESAQRKALSSVEDRNRQAKPYKGCFRLLAKVYDTGKQEELYDIETELHHNFVANGYLVHNSGKDICALNLLIRAALRRVGTYFYVFPTFSMGRRILWDAIDISGQKIMHHYVPEEIVTGRNQQQMKITLINGSQIQILGSDDVDKSLVGTNAIGIVYSEYALQDPHAWQLAIPILKASAGWALFISTVRGRNHFYDLYEVVKDRDDWFCEKLTIEDTKHITVEEIEKEIESGQISRDLAMQEFWNDFNLGVEGSFYGKYIDDLRKKGQIGNFPYEPGLLTHTFWDLGYNDSTVIIFAQLHGPTIRIIDHYENNKQGLEHYAQVVKQKPYVYGKHIAPHDIAVHDLSTGVSRWKMMHDLGITFMRTEGKLPSIDDGIEAVRRILPKCWFDERSCGKLIKALENYRQEYDNKRKVYKSQPLHDVNSHSADAMRYLALALPKLTPNSSPQELKDRYNRAMYGDQVTTGFFSDFKGY